MSTPSTPPRHPGPDPERLLQTFLEMVRIDSPSGQEDAMRDYLKARLAELPPTEVSLRTDAGGNLIVDIPAHADCTHGSILVWSGHMDVVPPCEGIQPVVTTLPDGDRLIASDNTTVLGADDKAALAPMLETLLFSLRHQTLRPALRLIFTTREETSLGGAKELDDQALQAHFAVTLDHTGEPGVIIHQAPTYIDFEVTCQGKSVHAGIMPEQGVNAIAFAAEVIHQLHLGRIDGQTTANIGLWSGGKGTNVVPDSVVFQGELRGHDPDTLARELAHIEQTLAEVSARRPGTAYTWRHQVGFEGYQVDPHHVGVQHVMAAVRQTGLEPRLVRTNGGSDNNVFVQRGLPGVVMSAAYVDPHTLQERVRLSDMVTCSRFLLNLLERCACEPF